MKITPQSFFKAHKSFCVFISICVLILGIGAFKIFSSLSTKNTEASLFSASITNTTKYVKGDFNGDSKSDVLWRNKSTGQVYIWLMEGISKGIEGSPATVEDLNWEIKDTGDFNGDLKSDVLWRNKSTGKVYIWIMDGIKKAIKPESTEPYEGSPATVEDLNWEIQGTGDFNGDLKSDVLWRNKLTGQVYIWIMEGISKGIEGSPATVEDLNWEIKATGDFNDDLKYDILWKNSKTGQVYIWIMNGIKKASKSVDLKESYEGSPATVDDLNWEIQSTGDFNGDSKSDVLWKNSKTGQVYVWIMDGIKKASKSNESTEPYEGSPATVEDLNWEIKGTGDFNGDSKYDVLWKNNSTGEVRVWLMNGTEKLSEGSPATVEDLNWGIIGQLNQKIMKVNELKDLSVIKIITSSGLTCSLLSDKTVKCWGINEKGQVGNGTTENIAIPVPVKDLSNIEKISIGYSHSCALLTDKTVKCWGENGYGQIGDGTTENKSIPVSVKDLSNVEEISTGFSHSCAILTDKTVKCWGADINSLTPVTITDLYNVEKIALGGNYSCALLADTNKTVKCWGYNIYGQLGDGTTENKSIPVSVKDLSNVEEISIANSSSCALLTDKTVKCWGFNSSGQLGDGTIENKSIPVSVKDLSNVEKIIIGYSHSCALLADTNKTVKCWGGNESSQLGDDTTENQSIPVPVKDLFNVEEIITGYSHTCALLTDKTVKCWGANIHGQIGDETTENQSIPVLVKDLSNVEKIALGSDYSCALLTDKTIKCWGNNQYGQLGNNTFKNSSIPVNTLFQYISTCAKENENLGAVIPGNNKQCCEGLEPYIEPNRQGTRGICIKKIKDLTGTWSEITEGAIYSWDIVQTGDLLNIKTNNYENFTGKVDESTNSVEFYNTPRIYDNPFKGNINDTKDFISSADGDTRWQLKKILNPVTLTMETADDGQENDPFIDLKNVEDRQLNFCYIEDQKYGVDLNPICTLKVEKGDSLTLNPSFNIPPDHASDIISYIWEDDCTGSKDKCDLLMDSDKKMKVKSVYIPVSTESLASQVAQISISQNSSCAILADKTVKCWGNNVYGILGDGTRTNRSTPVSVLNLSNVEKISRGNSFYCALLTDKTVKCWGENSFGQLGNKTTNNQSIPVLVEGLSDVEDIFAGYYYSCAILTDKSLKCWGKNYNGQLGNGTTINQTSPVSVLSNVKDVYMMDNFACALLTDKTVKCWGNNKYGQLGDGTTINKLTPVSVKDLKDVEKISIGNYSYAILADSTVKSWGLNDFGQLGNGTNTNQSIPNVIKDLYNVKEIYRGIDFACVLLTDKTVKCWGVNNYSQLGIGNTTSQLTPLSVKNLKDVEKILINGSAVCSFLSDKTLKCWGENYGKIGNGTTENQSTPVSILSNVEELVMSNYFACAKLSDKSVNCWGQNSSGQIGDGTTTNRLSPVHVSGLIDVNKIIIDGYSCCSILSDKTVKCWGYNKDGQLGDGTTENRSSPVTPLL